MIEVFIIKTLLSVFVLLVICLIMFGMGYSVGKEEGKSQQIIQSRDSSVPKFSYKEWKREQEKLDKQSKQ